MQGSNLADQLSTHFVTSEVHQKKSNFYTLDTETDGFFWDGGKNTPIQIVATMYREGQECEDEFYSKYFLPRGKITDSAHKTHKLTVEKLKAKGA